MRDESRLTIPATRISLKICINNRITTKSRIIAHHIIIFTMISQM